MDWWNNLWLSEGFASYLELGVINYLNPQLPGVSIMFFPYIKVMRVYLWLKYVKFRKKLGKLWEPQALQRWCIYF